MSLQKLVDKFADEKALPIEIPEVRDAVIAMNFQDTIIFCGEDSDPGKCRGVYVQFTRRQGVYGETELVSLIVYCNRLPPEWQRIVACKELIHVMDDAAEKTKTKEELEALADKILGPLSSEDYGLADVMAAKDKLALYQALAILFPNAARAEAIAAVSNDEMTIEEVADWCALPLNLVRLVMSAQWPKLRKALLDC